jgi:hypothetical protein
MASTLRDRLRRLAAYSLARLGENSTIQGLAAIGTLAGGYSMSPERIAEWAALAAVVSGILKIILPDSITKSDI